MSFTVVDLPTTSWSGVNIDGTSFTLYQVDNDTHRGYTLLESGDFMLKEDSGKIILDSQYTWEAA